MIHLGNLALGPLQDAVVIGAHQLLDQSHIWVSQHRVLPGMAPGGLVLVGVV